MTDTSAQPRLRQAVGLLGVVTLGAGTAIGVSIFTVLAPAAEIAGAGLLLALVVAAIPMLLIALVYSYLGSVSPVSGASYEWPSRYLHPFVGFAIAWLRILANVGALTVLSQVLIEYLSMVVALPLKPMMAVLLTVVFGLNYLGVSLAAKVQSILLGVLLAILAALVAFGAPHITLAMIGAPLSAGAWPILAAAPLMIGLFMGIETAVEIGEEVCNARRNIPLGIALAMLLTTVVYGLVAFTALGLLGPQGLARSPAPLLDAARAPFGQWAAPLIVAAASASIFKSMNSAALTFSRSLFAMSRGGALPSWFSVLSARFGTPHRAILLAYGLAMSGLLLPSSLIFLLLAVNVPIILKYIACSLAAWRVAGRYPELHTRSPLGIPRRWVQVTGLASALCGVLVAIAGLQADARPYLLIAGWLTLGVIYWLWTQRRQTT